MVGRGDHLDEIFVAERIGLRLRPAGDQHQPAVLLGDHRRRRAQPRRVGAEQELRLVLDDQARVELLHAAALRLVVIGDEADLVALVADLQSAGLVDLVAPQLGAALLRHRIDVERPGLRQRHADRQRVFLGEGGAAKNIAAAASRRSALMISSRASGGMVSAMLSHRHCCRHRMPPSRHRQFSVRLCDTGAQKQS